MSIEKSQQGQAQATRWEKPELRRVGNFADIVRGSGPRAPPV